MLAFGLDASAQVVVRSALPFFIERRRTRSGSPSSLEPDEGSVVCGSARGLLLGGEELAGLFEECAQLVVAVRAEKVVEMLFEGLLASGALAVGFLASGGDVEANAAAGAQPSLEISQLLQSCDDLADRLLGLGCAARDFGHGDPWPG